MLLSLAWWDQLVLWTRKSQILAEQYESRTFLCFSIKKEGVVIEPIVSMHSLLVYKQPSVAVAINTGVLVY